jgi:recombinational DNA repair protein (RecF pathway)
VRTGTCCICRKEKPISHVYGEERRPWCEDCWETYNPRYNEVNVSRLLFLVERVLKGEDDGD